MHAPARITTSVLAKNKRLPAPRDEIVERHVRTMSRWKWEYIDTLFGFEAVRRGSEESGGVWEDIIVTCEIRQVNV
jgi:hypothetical protein